MFGRDVSSHYSHKVVNKNRVEAVKYKEVLLY